MFGRKYLAILMMTVLLFSSLSRSVYAETSVTDTSDIEAINIDCDLHAFGLESLPAYRSSLKTWKEESIAKLVKL